MAAPTENLTITLFKETSWRLLVSGAIGRWMYVIVGVEMRPPVNCANLIPVISLNNIIVRFSSGRRHHRPNSLLSDVHFWECPGYMIIFITFISMRFLS